MPAPLRSTPPPVAASPDGRGSQAESALPLSSTPGLPLPSPATDSHPTSYSPPSQPLPLHPHPSSPAPPTILRRSSRIRASASLSAPATGPRMVDTILVYSLGSLSREDRARVGEAVELFHSNSIIQRECRQVMEKLNKIKIIIIIGCLPRLTKSVPNFSLALGGLIGGNRRVGVVDHCRLNLLVRWQSSSLSSR